MRKDNRTARKLKKFAWRFNQPGWADNHGITLPVKHALVSPGIAREIYLGDYEAKEIDIISKRLATDDIVFEVGAELATARKICVKTHPDVLGYKVLSEMFAGLVAKGFALDFSLIRKNVFFFHRVA